MDSLSTVRDILTTAPIDVAVGAVIVIAYLVTHLIRKQANAINLANSITVFGSGFSLLPSLSVLLASFATVKPTANGVEQSYFFIGGFAVIYLGLQEIIRKFREIP